MAGTLADENSKQLVGPFPLQPKHVLAGHLAGHLASPWRAARSPQSASHLRLLMPLLFLLGHPLFPFLSKQVFSISCGLSRSVLFLSVKSPWWTQLSTPNIVAASLCSLPPLINPAKSCALAFSIPAFDRTLILASFVALDH
jgi:hypothetical protein